MKGAKDTFTFQNGQFKSTGYQKRGFSPTNYTITIPSETEETGIWETMLSGEEGVVFIRGEWNKETMNGSITEQLEDGKEIFEHSFSTNSRVAISPTSAEEETKVAEEAGQTLSAALVSNETAVPASPGETKNKTSKKR